MLPQNPFSLASPIALFFWPYPESLTSPAEPNLQTCKDTLMSKTVWQWGFAEWSETDEAWEADGTETTEISSEQPSAGAGGCVEEMVCWYIWDFSQIYF